MSKTVLSLIAGGLAAGLAAPAPAAAPFDGPGPQKVVHAAEGPDCTVFHPTDLGGKPHPVILWGNGTKSKVAGLYAHAGPVGELRLRGRRSQY